MRLAAFPSTAAARSPYSKLIVNATGFFPPPLPASALHCFFPTWFLQLPLLLPGLLGALEILPGRAGNRTRTRKKRVFGVTILLSRGRKGGVRVSMSNHEDRVSHPCKALIVCTRSQGRTLLQLNVLCSPSAGGRGSMQNERTERIWSMFSVPLSSSVSFGCCHFSFSCSGATTVCTLCSPGCRRGGPLWNSRVSGEADPSA